MITTKLQNLRLILMLLLLSMMPNAFASDNAECKNVIRFQPVTELSMDYLGWLADPVSNSSAQGGVVFWPFDEESHPTKGEWVGLGVVLANTGDISSRSIGGIIWVRREWQSRITFEAAQQRVARIHFIVQAKQAGCDKTIDFEIGADQTVHFGAESIGRVKSLVE